MEYLNDNAVMTVQHFTITVVSSTCFPLTINYTLLCTVMNYEMLGILARFSSQDTAAPGKPLVTLIIRVITNMPHNVVSAAWMSRHLAAQLCTYEAAEQ